MFLAGLFSGFVILGLFLTFVFPRLMFTISESKYVFNRTVEEITESTKSNNWKIPNQYDLQQIMANKDLR